LLCKVRFLGCFRSRKAPRPVIEGDVVFRLRDGERRALAFGRSLEPKGRSLVLCRIKSPTKLD